MNDYELIRNILDQKQVYGSHVRHGYDEGIRYAKLKSS